jgi:hypothetical protein
MEDSDDSISRSQDLHFSRASTCDIVSNQNANHGGLAPFPPFSTSQGQAILQIEDSAGISGSESGQSNFSTIITVDDLGFGASWQQQVQKYSFRDYSSPENRLPQTTNEDQPVDRERQMSLDAVTLTTVGDQFPSSSPVPHGSGREMVNSFAEELKDEIEKDEIEKDEIEKDELEEDGIRKDDIRNDDVTPDKSQKELWNALVASKHDSSSSNFFVPQDQLSTIINDFNVKGLLRHTFPYRDDRQLHDTFDEICSKDHHKSRRMILAVLVMMGRVAYIEDFIREDIRDIHIPLVPYHEHHRCVLENAFHKRNDEASTPPLTFRNWRHIELRQFFDLQYRVLAPYFDIRGDRVCFYKLDSSITLPFLEYSREQDGGHGSVWKAKIHPAHHNFESEQVNQNHSLLVESPLLITYNL